MNEKSFGVKKAQNNGSMQEVAGLVSCSGSQEDFASLISKIASVMGRVRKIEKKGHNSYHDYDYVREEDIVNEIRRHLAKENIVVLSSIKELEKQKLKDRNGRTKILADLAMYFTFADGDTGATATIEYAGEGIDSGDKAIYKAYAGVTKYALMKNFLIPSGNDDPERDSYERNGAQNVEDTEQYVQNTQNSQNKGSREKTNTPKSKRNQHLTRIRKYYKQNSNAVERLAFETLVEHGKKEDISLLSELDEEVLENLIQRIENEVNKEKKKEAS